MAYVFGSVAAGTDDHGDIDVIVVRLHRRTHTLAAPVYST